MKKIVFAVLAALFLGSCAMVEQGYASEDITMCHTAGCEITSVHSHMW